MSDKQWVVDAADVDEENCIIRIQKMHCPECGYDPIAASQVRYINALNVLTICPNCGTDGDKKKKTFLVEMDSAPIMGMKTPCECPVCLSGPHPMCLIAGAQVEKLDHCPVLREADWRGLAEDFMHAFNKEANQNGR